jgi:hypothetical protein
MFGALGAGCMNDRALEEDVDDTSSAITIDVNAAYTVVGVGSNKCVGVVDASTATHARLDIETCSGTSSQRFHPEAMGGGFFRLRNERSGLCADVLGEGLTDGTLVIQFTCGTGLNQQWSFTDVAGGAERITVRHSGEVLDVTGEGTADGTLLEQWTSNNQTNQQFRLATAVAPIAPN